MSAKEHKGIFFLLAISLAVMLISEGNSAYGVDQVSGKAGSVELSVKETSWLEAHPTVTVGMMESWPPMNYVDEDMTPRGIGVDYLKVLNERLGGILKIVPGPFKENMERVKHRELDALMDITPKKERERFFHFTRSYLSIPHVIVARIDGPYFSSEADLKGKVVALEKGFYNVRYFHDNHPEVTVREYDSTSAALDAVSRAEADAYAGNRAVVLYLIEKELMTNLQVQGRLAKPPTILTIGVRKDWPELAGILDKGLKSITIEEEHLIKRKWLGDNGGAHQDITAAFTPEEREWLGKKPIIWVGNAMDFAPYDFAVGKQPLGYGVDLLNLLAGRIGVNFRYVNGYSTEELDKMCEQKIIDLANSVVVTPERSSFGLFSKPYMTLKYHFVVPAGAKELSDTTKLNGETVAVIENSVVDKYIQEKYPAVKRLQCSSMKSALESVVEGKAAAAISDILRAGYLISKDDLKGVRISGEFTELSGSGQSALHFMGNEDTPELIHILNKALDSLAPGDIQRLEQKWFGGLKLPQGSTKIPRIEDFDQAGYLLKAIAAVFCGIAFLCAAAWFFHGCPKIISIRLMLFTVLLVFAGITTIIGASLTRLLELEREYAEVDSRRYQSIRLAHELKQSSEDLTIFARAYTVTGDIRYEKLFQRIIAVRDGKAHHPRNDAPSYWAQLVAGEEEADSGGALYSIEEKIITLGLTGQERQRLLDAKSESDELARLETIAFNAVKGIFRDHEGNYTLRRAPDLEMARKLVHGMEYNQSKAKIMKQINDFFSLLELRIGQELLQIDQKTKAVILAITTLAIMAIAFAIFSFFLLRRRIITPLYLLKAGATKLKDGDYSHYIDISSRDEAGELAAAFNAMAQSIKERTEKLRSIIDTAVDGIIVISSRGIMEEFSPAAERIFGYKADEVIGKNVSMLMPEPLSSNHNRYIEQYLAQGQTRKRELRLESLGLRSSGEQFPLSISLSEAEMGQEILFTGIVRDITQRKEAERELRKLSSVVEQSPVSIVITDKEGNVEYINRSFSAMTGYSFADVEGKISRIFVSDEYPQEFVQQLWDTILAGETWFGEMVNRTKDGVEICEHVVVTPLLGENGEITHFAALKEDITERKEIESELNKNMEELQRFSDITIGREERMIDLKQEVNELLDHLGREHKYKIVE